MRERYRGRAFDTNMHFDGKGDVTNHHLLSTPQELDGGSWALCVIRRVGARIDVGLIRDDDGGDGA